MESGKEGEIELIEFIYQVCTDVLQLDIASQIVIGMVL